MSVLPSEWIASRPLNPEVWEPFPEYVWDPYYPFPALSSSSSTSSTDICRRETAEAYIVKMALPVGMRKEDVSLSVEEQCSVLIIEGGGQSFVKEDDQQSETRHHHRVAERRSGCFSHRIPVPENTRLDGVKAAMVADGELTITLPKITAADKKKVHAIPICGP